MFGVGCCEYAAGCVNCWWQRAKRIFCRVRVCFAVEQFVAAETAKRIDGLPPWLRPQHTSMVMPPAFITPRNFVIGIRSINAFRFNSFPKAEFH